MKAMLALPQSGYGHRMKIYLAEMYPLPKHLLASVLLYFSLSAFISRVHDVRMPVLSPYSLLGVWSLLAVTLLSRLMDELKDKDIDRELFRDRPLPSGRVFESDIAFSIVAVVVLYIAANIWTGPALWMALLILGYSLLAFKHFFFPDLLRKNLLLTLATHNLLVPMVYLHLLAVCSAQFGWGFEEINWRDALLVIVMYWAASFAWEIARKIRAPEEENAYVTYSQIFTPLGAVLVAATAQTAAFVIGLFFYQTLSLSSAYVAILTVGYGLSLAGYLRFLFKPIPATSGLKIVAEGFMLCVFMASILEDVFFV